MSNTYQEAVLHEDEPLLSGAPAKSGHWTRWPKWLLVFAVCLWLVDTGLSLLVRHTNLHQRFTERIAAAFGRPVTVGQYDFSLLTGPTLTAQYVEVGEDPRFGNEYFLRADSMNVRLRWGSLLRGHLVLGTLLLTRPSLNVARDSNGDWNLADWLPESGGSSSLVGPREPAAPLFQRIEIDGGRINFKNGDNKLPLAFVDVTGAIDTQSSGLWNLDLRATPWRAASILQQPGTIRVTGQIGGTSARLLPAALNITWTEASVSDVLRLAQNYDHGIRGDLNLAFSTHTEGSSWILQGRAELRQLHRWDLAVRTDNPSLNVIARMRLYPLASGLEISQATLETPGSNAKGSGSIVWSQPAAAKHKEIQPASQVQVVSSSIDLTDVLSWLRAFDGDVADDFSLHGFSKLDAEFSGWPLKLSQASVSSTGAVLTGQRLLSSLNVGPIEFHYDGSGVSLLPVALSFGPATDPSAGLFHLDATVPRHSKGPAVWHFAGSTAQVRDLIGTAAEFGWNPSHGWDLAGPFHCDLKWPAGGIPGQSQPVGFAELGGGSGAKPVNISGASLNAPFLNQAVDQLRARADWQPDTHHITLASAQAFGAHWSGTFDRGKSGDGWQFNLSADRLASADLDQWLNPRWRESLIDRMLPFFNSRARASAIPENLRASGRLSLDQFVLAPLTVRRLRGGLKLDGRHVQFEADQDQFYGGQVTGSFDADLQPIPAYRINANFSNVDLSALASVSSYLADTFDGLASGEIAVSVHGAARADLLASLECRGSADIRNVRLHNIDLNASFTAGARRSGDSSFREASASFICKDRQVAFQDLQLLAPGMHVTGVGTIDPTRYLDFNLNVFSGNADVKSVAAANVKASANIDAGQATPLPDAYRLTGPLASPQIEKTPRPRPPRIR